MSHAKEQRWNHIDDRADNYDKPDVQPNGTPCAQKPHSPCYVDLLRNLESLPTERPLCIRGRDEARKHVEDSVDRRVATIEKLQFGMHHCWPFQRDDVVVVGPD